MKHIAFYLDFISPYAYLAFEQLPRALQGLSYGVAYRPVLFAGMLQHFGQLGPAEIAPKRDWTYRQVLWQAQALDIALQHPASHPFNPLSLLRLALACSPSASPGEPGRYVCESIFRHVWQGGLEAADETRVDLLASRLVPCGDRHGRDVKAELKSNTAAAIEQGVFGVPSFVVDDKVFWGLDSLPMLRSYLLGNAWFDGPWDAAAAVGQGVIRR
jgi:2-hydroxychromene-2-carboxylate isomerase